MENKDRPFVEHAPSIQDAPTYAAMAQAATGAAPAAASAQPTTLKDNYTAMRKSIRSYGIWILISGVANLAVSSDRAWAVILLAAGLLAFYFFDAAGMLLLYATMFAWAALTNVLSGEASWIILAVLQVFWAFLAFRGFRRFRNSKRDYEAEQVSAGADPAAFSRRAPQFVWLALIFAALGILGLCGALPLALVYAVATSTPPPDGVFTAIAGTLACGALGIPMGAAALSAGYQPRAAGIAAVVMGSLCAVALIGLIVMAYAK